MTTDTSTTPATAPIETVTPIKPSEAIRLGCLLRPLKAEARMDSGTGACALGAMAFGYGWTGGDNVDGYVFLSGRIPESVQSPCDHDDMRRNGLGAVYHLNDAWHEWSRERIADWLEGLGL